MRKTLLIARREYLAFVRTVGFWLSIVTAPLIFTLIIAVPVLIRTSAPVEVTQVAILDLTDQQLEPSLRTMFERAMAPPQEGGGTDEAFGKVARDAFDKERIELVPLPAGLTTGMDRKAAEAKIYEWLTRADLPRTGVLVAYDDGQQLHFDTWVSEGDNEWLPWQMDKGLKDLQFSRAADRLGVDPEVVTQLRAVEGGVEKRRLSAAPEGEGEALAANLRDHGPRVIGIALGFVTWFTIFSSSMILLGGVIEEKASKVLEVLLASASTESLLIGKVLGVAAVLSTVGLIWGAAIFALVSQGANFLPPDIAQTLQQGLAGIFTPAYVVLLLSYFVGGYLMFGVTFAAIGAFCETQKDAQAIMGPLMIVLMVPMLCMQAAIGAPSAPIIQWLSWVPIFTPFLMPLRLSEPLPMWEIALTLGGMLAAAFLMIAVGRRAFKQGALTGGKLTWGTIARIATRKSNDA